jgi:hypothetical protein
VQLFVVLKDPMPDVPASTRASLLKALDEVAGTLSEIPVFSAVWDSLEAAPLQLDHQGWRFFYLVRRETGRLVVIGHKAGRNTPTSIRKRSAR